ncbi:hypothetical protein ACVWYF_001019 [Hymenobacter sp. UYAg731]
MLKFLLAAGSAPIRKRRFGSHIALLLLAGFGLMPSYARAQSQVLAQWALTSSNAPTYVTPTAGITAGAATLKRLNTASSTSPYSTTNGQSFAPDATGLWTSGAGGPGGTLNRKYYEQFTVAANTGTAVVRLDSLILTSAFNNSTSNTKVAVVYSKTGFTTNDSTEISGGTTNNGTALTVPGSGVGNFTKSFALLKNSAGPTNPIDNYRLALNGGTGVTLAAGQTLSIRLYYACGSSSSAIYAMLKNVTAKGQALTVGTVATTTAQISFNTPAAGGYTYAISTSPAGGIATQTTAPAVGNNYVATYTISGLTAGTAYTATVAGAGATATTITSPTFTTNAGTCNSPGTPAIGSIGQTSAAVSFTGAAGSTGYSLKYYPTATGTPVLTHALGAAATSDNLTSLTGGTDYTVTLQSTCALGTSTLLSTTFTTLTCADPTGLTVANATRTSSSASLSFVPGAANASYVATYYPTGSPGSAVTVSPAPTASPVVLTGLNASTSYTVTLQSVCANGAVGNVLSTTFATRVANSTVLQSFPLTTDAADDAAVRAAGVTASTGTLTGLVVSDGTSNDGESTVLPAYSSRGQGVAPSGSGAGWGGGVTLTRYTEFDVTAAAGGSLRVDSLVFNAGGYGSGAMVSVAYSTDNFANSTFILGSATTAVAITKASNPGYSVLRLALAGTTGVTLNAGNTVAFRLYFAIGSSSQRHALTRNLFVTGTAMPACPGATNASIGNVTATQAQLSFTPGAGNTAYTVSYFPTGSPASAVVLNPTASPVSLTGLNAATDYTVTLQANCGGTPGYAQSLYFTTSAASSGSIQQWPLTAGNADNAATRSYAVVASAPTLSGLNLSYNQVNATLGTPAIPTYSATYGQAFSPDNSGPAGADGGTSNGGGWSSNLSAGIYEQFDVTAAAGDNLRADSLVFSTAFYGTANGKVAVAYSTDGFATSTFIKGTSLTAADASPFYNSTNTLTTYRLLLNGGTGVARTSGQVLSFRFYFAAGTANQSRYAFLRNVYVAGEGFVNGLPNLTIGDTQTVPTGTYGNVTVVSGGMATLSGPLVVQGNTLVQSGGVLSTACQTVTGTNFTLAAGGELQICSPAGISASGSTGAVQVSGTRSFSPDAIYTYTGTLTNGANQQSGTGLPATVRSLKITLATATDSLQLNSDVTVNTSLALSRGVLKGYLPDGSAAHLLTLGRLGTISETATSFVLGQVQSATLSFVADGNSTGFGGLGLTLTAHTAGGAALPGSTYVVRTTGTPVYGVTPTAGANAGIISRSIRRQYRVVPTTETGLNMALVFGYSPTTAELNGIPVANLQLFSRPIAGGLWRPEGGTNSTNTVTLTSLNHLSDWTLGNKAAPLPVTLTHFEAERQDQQAILTWATATEHNSKGFAVQVSTDGREFRTAGFVPSANSMQAQAYRFVDAPANPTGTRYYRLQQIDSDGSSTYSVVRTLTFAEATRLAASPNPFTDVLFMNTQATFAAPTTFVFLDAAGRPVLKQVLAVPAGPAKLTLAGLGQLPRGFYVLRFELNNKLQYLKLLKD